MSNIKISVEDVKSDFKESLEIDGNNRIFFSGRFGIGKTFFLKEFFLLNSQDFDAYHLFPINYQISDNDDILDLIKYDILIELLNKDSNVFKENNVEGLKKSAFLFYTWFKDRVTINSALDKIISYGDIFSMPIVKKLGRPLRDLLKIDKEFQEFKNEYKNGEKGLAKKYIDKIKEKDISESDYLSHLLKEKISLLKDKKKSVLILDDLDRIDPEHIFRILNILSAYFEKEQENKFGFDLIIIVADYSNLKNIFNHRYGMNTDFSGYLDKFFTVSPYYYDNKKAILNTIDEISKNIKNGEPNLSSALSDSGYIKLFLDNIFSKAMNYDLMNLRELLKSTRFQLSELKKGCYYEDHFADNFQKIFDKAIKIAIHSFSNTDKFIAIIKDIKKREIIESKPSYIIKFILTMFKALNIKMPDNDGEFIDWKDYRIIGEDNSSYKIKIENNLEMMLFYDLLVEYIENKKHLRGDYRY